MTELISIITPAFNCVDTIEETYLSLQNQTYSNWEWVVTDDCSNDRTPEILNRIQAKDSRVHIFYNKINSGAAVSRNNSLDNANGKYLAFIDSDDIWVPEKLKLQMDFMKSNDYEFSFTGYAIVDKLGELVGKTVDTTQSEALNYSDMLRKKATLGCSTVMLDRKLLGNLRMPLLRTGQDYAFWLQILRDGTLAHPIPQALTQYRIMPNSISRNKLKKALRQWEIYRNCESLSLISTIECFFFYAYRALIRKQ